MINLAKDIFAYLWIEGKTLTNAPALSTLLLMVGVILAYIATKWRYSGIIDQQKESIIAHENNIKLLKNEISIKDKRIDELENLSKITREKGQIEHRPINIDDFDTIENPGVAIHKKSKEIFCLKCLIQKNKKSPLIIDHSKGYMCRNCGDIIFHIDSWEEFMEFSKEWRLKTT